MAKYNMAELETAVSRVKIRFMQTPATTFFSALLSNLYLMITEEGCKTACTNGIYLKLNPYFITPLNMNQLMGLMLHEVLHVVFDHILRCHEGKLDPKMFNIAADHYINLMILAMRYELPPDGYHDPKYKGWGVMKIYKDIMRNPPPDLGGYIPDIMPAPKGMTKQQHKHVVTGNLLKAVTQAEMSNQAGSIPGEVLRRLDEILNPKLPWNVILQDYWQPFSKEDYSWGRPNRRYFPEFYLPSLDGESLKQLTAGADVSGSMTTPDLIDIHSEIVYIWDILKPESMRLQTFDTKVHLDEMYQPGDTLDELELKGGGGTNVVPLLKSIREEEPEISLIFTDGYFTTPDMTGIHTDIIWIIKNNPKFQIPHGEIIHFN